VVVAVSSKSCVSQSLAPCCHWVSLWWVVKAVHRCLCVSRCGPCPRCSSSAPLQVSITGYALWPPLKTTSMEDLTRPSRYRLASAVHIHRHRLLLLLGSTFHSIGECVLLCVTFSFFHTKLRVASGNVSEVTYLFCVEWDVKPQLDQSVSQ